MENLAALEARRVTRMFGPVAGLADVSLAVRPGEIHGLLGEDGAGKTTLLKILGGIYPAGSYTGEVWMNGQPVRLRDPRDAFRAGIAVLPHRLGIFPNLSVAENICLGPRREARSSLLRNTRDELARAEQILRRLGLNVNPLDLAAELTPNQQRLVTIARAVGTEPSALVLDEPMAGATAAEAASLIRILRDLAATNVASLYLTRSATEAAQMADRITVLRDGAVAGTFARPDYDLATLALAMMSQHPERAPGPETDETRSRWFAAFRSLVG